MSRAVPLFAALTLLALAAPAHAVTPDEQLADPKLEARAVRVSQELRCVVCQNETIDESEAPLAHDLRVLLRERLKAGDTDEQAKAWLVARYGHYVLLKPPVESETLPLWFGPLAVLALGGLAAAVHFRDRRRAAAALPPQLTAQEQAELDRLLGTAPANAGALLGPDPRTATRARRPRSRKTPSETA